MIALNIAYKWGFPFKLITDCKGTRVVINSLQQAEEFGTQLETEETPAEASVLIFLTLEKKGFRMYLWKY